MWGTNESGRYLEGCGERKTKNRRTDLANTPQIYCVIAPAVFLQMKQTKCRKMPVFWMVMPYSLLKVY
jgi:hypothetical protein